MSQHRLAAVASAALVLTAGATVAPAAASAATSLPTLSVTITTKAVTVAGGTTVTAGRTVIRVTAVGGERDLQLLKLARGYGYPQAAADVAHLFDGSTATVRRVDRNIRFLGGADATPSAAGVFAETLYPGDYELVDTNGTAHTVLHVVGRPAERGWVNQTSTIIGNGKDRFVMPSAIPHAGWTLFRDTSDEPHFIVLQQVRPGTTAQQRADFLTGGSDGQPPFALPGAASSGVISGGTQMLWHYAVPKGEYAILCFWPSDDTGMPHANMGMYKLVTLT